VNADNDDDCFEVGRSRRETSPVGSAGNDLLKRRRLAKTKARDRAQAWRDHRRATGLPDNALLARLLFQYLLEADARQLYSGKPGLDGAFIEILRRLPPRFDRQATEALIKRYRDDALNDLADRQLRAG
jgi:hypothetical protein